MNDLFDFMNPMPTPVDFTLTDFDDPPKPVITRGMNWPQCYTCDTDLSRLPEGNFYAHYKEYTAANETFAYTLNLCLRCAHMHIKP